VTENGSSIMEEVLTVDEGDGALTAGSAGMNGPKMQ
jgi:hypothetical protein